MEHAAVIHGDSGRRLRLGARAGLALLVVLCSAAPASALDPQRSAGQYVFRTWTKRDGLPGAWVSAIVASRTGYVWLATPDGLVRFDGMRFTVFNRESSPGLPADGIRALHEGRDGRLWVATSRGLAVGDGRGASAFKGVSALSATRVGSIDEDGDGALWVVTTEAVWRLEGDRGTPVGATQGDLGERRALRADPSGGFWLATTRGLVRVDRSGAATTFTVREGLPSDDVLSVLVDKDGAVWAGTGNGVARRIKGGAFEKMPAGGRRIVLALAQDHDGNVWAATHDGLLRLAGGRPELIGRAEGLLDEHTRTLAEDADGNLWVGTETGGLARLRNGRAAVYGRAQGLGHDVVWSVTEGRDGSMWVGTDGGGLNRLRDGRSVPATTEPDLAHENVYALLEDRSGRVWFSTESHGLCSLTAGRVRCTSISADEGVLRCLIEDKAGRIWAGTSLGLLRIEAKGEGMSHVAADDGKPLTVKVLEEAPDGTLWVGTSSGLARLEGGVVRRVAIGGKPHGDDVDALHSDADGTLWIGTIHAGLQRLRAGRLAVVTRSQGLPGDTVLSVLDDGVGRLWISGDGIFGLSRADVEAAADGQGTQIRAVMITEAEGLRDRECSGGVQPSAWQARDGRLWFPTIAGVAVVDPRQVGVNNRPLSTLVEGFVADGRTLVPGTTLDVPAGTRHIEIRYTAPSFAAPERVRFEHRLEGLEHTFFPAGTDRVAHYSVLGPGHYRFTVHAANEDGLWAKDTTSFQFSVLPYFWQTLWFYALCGVGLLLAAWGTFEVRVRGLRHRELLLRQRVAEELAQVRVLKGMLPICAWCKKVRDDAGYWKQIEAYISDHTEAEFTHGICPDCAGRLRAGK